MACLGAARKSGSSHLFLGWPRRGWWDRLSAGLIKSHNFFVLGPILVKFSHSNSAKQELSNDVSYLEVRPRKVAFHTCSHLTPIEAWRRAVSTTSEGGRVSSKGWLENCTQVGQVGQIWTACDSWLRKNSASHLFWLVQTCPNLSKPVRTCPNLSTIQWPCTLVTQCHFLHFRMLLFFGLSSYPGEIAYFNSPNEELSNGVRVMAL